MLNLFYEVINVYLNWSVCWYFGGWLIVEKCFCYWGRGGFSDGVVWKWLVYFVIGGLWWWRWDCWVCDV